MFIKTRHSPVIIFLLALTSCSTYTIPVDNFKKQFAGMDSSKMVIVNTQGPLGSIVQYQTLPIRYIECIDKKGRPFQLTNSPSIEIRFTDVHNKKTIFYFDLITVTDSTVVGRQSRMIKSIHKTLSLTSIKKIEVQDGRKNYHYTN
jgi:hypothetical protein